MSNKSNFVHYLKLFWLWVGAFWSVIFVVAAGGLYFREAIVDSIESTPHPALVYLIFAVAACSVLLLMHALHHYTRESVLVNHLQTAKPTECVTTLKSLRWVPDLLPVYQLAIDRGGRGAAIADALENELVACEDKVLSRLSLASYLGGALVGLGLVGTFVGLLGTLTDLGRIFELLVNVGAKDVDPVAMFGGMIARLQEPMRGMSTAFVASLYGLMGSLVIGLVSLSVRKAGINLCKEARELVRDDLLNMSQEAAAQTTDTTNAIVDLLPAIEGALNKVSSGVQVLSDSHAEMLSQSRQVLAEHRKLVDSVKGMEIHVDSLRRDLHSQMEEHLRRQMKLLETYKPEPARKLFIALSFVGCASLLVTAGVVVVAYQQYAEELAHKRLVSEILHAPSEAIRQESFPKADSAASAEQPPSSVSKQIKELESQSVSDTALSELDAAQKKSSKLKKVAVSNKKAKIEAISKKPSDANAHECQADQADCDAKGLAPVAAKPEKSASQE